MFKAPAAKIIQRRHLLPLPPAEADQGNSRRRPVARTKPPTSGVLPQSSVLELDPGVPVVGTCVKCSLIRYCAAVSGSLHISHSSSSRLPLRRASFRRQRSTRSWRKVDCPLLVQVLLIFGGGLLLPCGDDGLGAPPRVGPRLFTRADILDDGFGGCYTSLRVWRCFGGSNHTLLGEFPGETACQLPHIFKKALVVCEILGI